MTVSELIEELKKQDQHLQVLFVVDNGHYENINTVYFAELDPHFALDEVVLIS